MIKLEDFGAARSNDISSMANLSPSYSFEFESLGNVVKTMLSSNHRCIPIVSKNHDLVGIVTYMDVLGALLRGLSKNTRVSEFMTREVVYSEFNESVGTVLQKIKFSKHDDIPILDNKKLSGMISEYDFVKLLFRKYLNVPVGKSMTHKPFFMSPDISIGNCMKTMVNTHYRRFPVVDNNELVGIVTGKDMLSYLDGTNYNPVSLNERVKFMMSSPVVYVTENNDVSEAIKLMLDNNIGGLVVIDEGNHLKGIITERDVVELI